MERVRTEIAVSAHDQREPSGMFAVVEHQALATPLIARWLHTLCIGRSSLAVSHGASENRAAVGIELSMMRRTIAVALLAVAWGASPAQAQVSDADRRHLLAHMEMTAGWLVDEVVNLNDAQVHFRPAPAQWSVAEVLDHLVVVAPIYWQDLQSALEKPPSRSSAMTDAEVLWYGIDRTRREEALPTERPSGQLRDLRTALDEYRKHHDRLLQYVRTTRDDLRGHIVERQGCDAYQWALLISTHEQRHILQIREIKAHAGFPKSAK